MSVNDLPVGRCVEETLRLVKAFQFVETHGEVCPASWTPESPTVSTASLFLCFTCKHMERLFCVHICLFPKKLLVISGITDTILGEKHFI